MIGEMVEDPNRFQRAIEAIDAANAADPRQVSFDDRDWPYELLYARRMTEWLDRLEPDASEALRLAARCQHVRRWEVPRETYPMTREGYHRWRTAMYGFHAEKAAEILREVGYDEAAVSRVQSLLRKEGLRSDPEMRTLEDVICLVFLENYFTEFARDRDEGKLVTILQRTWRKMTPRGHAAALALDLPAEDRRLIEKALASAPQHPAGPEVP